VVVAAVAVVRDEPRAPSLRVAVRVRAAWVAAAASRGDAPAAEADPERARSTCRHRRRLLRRADSNPDSLSSPARHKPDDGPMQFMLLLRVCGSPSFSGQGGIGASV
jgi:hypothetical protein